METEKIYILRKFKLLATKEIFEPGTIHEITKEKKAEIEKLSKKHKTELVRPLYETEIAREKRKEERAQIALDAEKAFFETAKNKAEQSAVDLERAKVELEKAKTAAEKPKTDK